MTVFLAIATAFEWFAGTKIGRIVGLVALVMAALVIAYFKVKAIGRAEERERSKKETDKLIKDKEKIDEDIAGASDSDVDDRMRPWIRQ